MKNNFKKITALLLSAMMLLAFASCKGNESPQKPTQAGNVQVDVGDNAMLINNMTISRSQFAYYYTTSYNFYAQMEANYQAQGYSLGFDATRPPDEVMSGQFDEDGNEMTWNDVIVGYATSMAKNNFAFYAEATASGYSLSEEDEANIAETLASIDDYASRLGMSTDEYIDKYVASGLDRDGVEKLLEIESVAIAYEEVLRENASDSITDEQVRAKYEESPGKYSYVDFYYCRVPIPAIEQAENETDREFEERYNETAGPLIDEAKEIEQSATSFDAFTQAAESAGCSVTEADAVTYSSAEASFVPEAVEWIYSSERTQGETAMFEGETACVIIMMKTPCYSGRSVDVRHCLIEFDSDEPTDEEKQEKYEIAAELLAQLTENGITEDNFIAMVTENSDDAASVPDGGLYEEVTLSSNYVTKFESWSLDPSRTVGDCEIIETEHGYHIMYFVEYNGADWAVPIRQELGAQAFEELASDLLSEDGGKYVVTVNDTVINEVATEFCEKKRNS